MDRGADRDGLNEDGPPLAASPLLRGLFWIAGSLALLLGLAGLFLPVLPTTPFILLAAACYARASRRLHDRLLAHPAFGPVIREWQAHRSLPYRTKRIAIALMSVSITVSIIVVRQHPWLPWLLAMIGVAAGGWLWRIPSRDAPPPR